MKACMLAYTFYESDNRVRRYAETLARRGDEVDAIALRRPGQPAFEIINGVNVIRIQRRARDEKGPVSYLKKLVLFFIRSAWTLSIRHLRSPYEIVHVHSVPDFEVFAAIVPRLMGARVILDIHDIVPEFYASKFRVPTNSFVFRVLLRIEQLSAAFSNHVIIANHLWYKTLTERSVARARCTPIINYPDLSIFWRRPRPASGSDDFVICYPGTLNWHQGLDLAVNAVNLLRDMAPTLKLLIIGDGPDREKLRVLIHRLELEDRVTMTGAVPIEDVAATMARIDLGVVPKRKDSFGNEAFSTKIMEFMAMGVPVLAANTRIDKYYFNENLVEFFESGDVEELAAKILSLMRDPCRRKTLCEHGVEFVRKNNWDERKWEYLGLVDRLLSHQGPVPA